MAVWVRRNDGEGGAGRAIAEEARERGTGRDFGSLAVSFRLHARTWKFFSPSPPIYIHLC